MRAPRFRRRSIFMAYGTLGLRACRDARMPLLLVAKNLGHTSTRMVEKHYGHLAPSFVADTIRATAPRFGVKATGNVKRLRP